jgi:hypothetical protein
MLLIIFLCYTGHDLQIFVPEGKAVHSEFYIQVLKGNEADVMTEAAIFGGQQLLHFVQQFPYSLYYYS